MERETKLTMPHVAAIQMNSKADVDQNLHDAANLIAQAAEKGSRLVVLPEMFPLFGLSEDKIFSAYRDFNQPRFEKFLSTQAFTHHIWLVGGSFPAFNPAENKAYNTCLVFNPQGEQVARYDKIHLFDVTLPSAKNVYQESSFICSGNNLVVIDTEVGRIGIAICYDIRFPEIFRALVAKGCEIFVIPTAFTFETGKAHWEVLLRARAIENFCYVIGACQEGLHANGRQTFGHSMIVNPWGEVLAVLPTGEGVITAQIDLDELKDLRRKFPVLEHRCLY